MVSSLSNRSLLRIVMSIADCLLLRRVGLGYCLLLRSVIPVDGLLLRNTALDDRLVLRHLSRRTQCTLPFQRTARNLAIAGRTLDIRADA
jgi:hypothetical protein